MPGQSDDSLIAELKAMAKPLKKLAKKLPAELGMNVLAERRAALETTVERVKHINSERTEAVNAKQAASKQARELLKRIRAAVRGAYGDDSTEYELVGGTRLSERKKPLRKAKTPA
jgi:flagellar biosynthesis/type III secretory pathway chaperone